MPSAAGIVEADETFIGSEPVRPKKRAYHHKMKVLSLGERETKQVRSVVVVDLTPDTVKPILATNIAKEASLFTDEAAHFVKLGKGFVEHLWPAAGFTDTLFRCEGEAGGAPCSVASSDVSSRSRRFD